MIGKKRVSFWKIASNAPTSRLANRSCERTPCARAWASRRRASSTWACRCRTTGSSPSNGAEEDEVSGAGADGDDAEKALAGRCGAGAARAEKATDDDEDEDEDEDGDEDEDDEEDDEGASGCPADMRLVMGAADGVRGVGLEEVDSICGLGASGPYSSERKPARRRDTTLARSRTWHSSGDRAMRTGARSSSVQLYPR